MSLNIDIYTAMGADAGIVSVISDRLYLLRLPQGTLSGPAISFSTTGDIPEHAHGMISVRKDAELTVNLWSTSTLTLESLKQAVITFWNAYDGALGSSYVSNATLNNVGYSYEDDTQLYHSVLIVNLQLRN
jgi:hypothetical protein